MTETDTGWAAITISALPSKRKIAERNLSSSESHLTAHRMRAVAGNGFFVMDYPIGFGGTVYGFDRTTSKMRWSVDPVGAITQMGMSFDGSAVVLTGYYCVQIIDSSGGEIASRCEEAKRMKMPLYQPGIPDISFWRGKKLFLVSLYLPNYNPPVRTIIADYEEGEIDDPEMFLMRIEGFSIDGRDYLVSARGSEITTYIYP